MFDEREVGRKQRPVTVLAVLFGLLLGFAGSTGAQVRIDPSTARLGHGDHLRIGFNLRNSPRPGEDAADDEAAPALVLPPLPRLVTDLVSVHPAADAGRALASAASLDRPFAYRARAPPAA